MLTRENIEHDLVYCPLSMGIMRHPVLASDGRHYELRILWQYFKRSENLISPVTRKPITSVIYDPFLKELIDAIYGEDEDREDNYEHKIFYDELLQIQTNYNQTIIPNTASLSSIFLGMMSTLIPALITLTRESIRLGVIIEELDQRYAIKIVQPFYLFGIGVGLVDYTIRRATDNRVGLIKSVMNAGITLFNYQHNRDNDEENNHIRLTSLIIR